MLKMLGIRLPEKLIEQVKMYVNEKKKERIYTIGEFVRVAIEQYLKGEKNDYNKKD